MAVEDLFFFKNLKTAIKVAEARGVIILAGVENGLPIDEFTPLQIKQAMTGYGRAEKGQMQKIVAMILGIKEKIKSDDAADALAVALTAGQSLWVKKIKWYMIEKFVLIIPNIRSGHNVGAMFRTADGAGVDKIYICGYSPTPPHPQVDKVSLGAE